MTEAIPCYYGGTTRLSTQYGAGNILHLTYRENAAVFSTTIAKGWWADANYDSNYYDRVRIGSGVKAKSAIGAGRLVAGDKEGYFNLAAGAGFDVSLPILWSTGTANAGVTTSNLYLSYPYCYLRTMLPEFSGAANQTCYLLGTLNGSLFTPVEPLLTSAVPETEDGYTYLALGLLTSAYQMMLYPEHPMYRFVDGQFKSIGQVACEAFISVNETRTEMQTKFEQTSSALALKADSSTVSALGERVSAAEQKVTPEAITSAVTSAALYAYDKYPGRNYCLNSGNVHTFVDNRYRYPSGASSSYTGWSLAVSDDLFAHSGNAASIRISFDIKRTNVDASGASSPNIYSGIWVYYKAYAEDGTTLTSYGRGWYLRTTDSSFNATDDDWVRMRYGPLNLSPYSPVEISHFSLGTSSANGTTGTVQFRNVKLEVLDSWTDWSAAPEDVYGLADRMTNAESRISQNASSIALKVSSSTYNSEKVYRSTTAPSTYSNCLWLDISLSPPILKRWSGSAWTAVGTQELKTSGISIGSNNVAITTENFLLQLLDPNNNENVLMEMSADGNVGFKELYADEVLSDSVVNAYTGPGYLYVSPGYTGSSPSYFRTVREAVASLNGMYLRKDVTITFADSTTENIYETQGIQVFGITGPYKLRIVGTNKNKSIYGYISIKSCSANISLEG